MKLSSQEIIEIVIAFCAYFGVAYAVGAFAPARLRVAARYVTVLAGVALFFYGLHRYIDEHARAVDLAKVLIAMGAALCVFYEKQREGMRRPIAERWKRFIGVTLGIAAIICYFNGFRFGYPKYYHRWDQFHYYMGAKYFPEMGYDGLYKCTLIAQNELGVVTYKNEDTGRTVRLDMSKEVRHPDKKIRNLGGDNLLIPASEVLRDPEVCKAHFSPERWEAYKADVQFFRTASDKGYWEDMQKDHGYNPPPVWTIMGKFWGDLHPASTRYLQFLASFDIVYLLGMFAALYWAFGWRVFSVAAIFWGCQASAPFYWTGGAFLRQDWLFFLVLSACLIRKRYFKLAGASMVYAGLLRVFPGLAVIGWLTVAGIYIFRHKRMARTHVQVLIGGVLAAAVLIPVSMKVAGVDSYRQFYEHTLKVHDQTPLTNHMGLRVLVAHKPGTGVESGRMRYTKDTKLTDPFEVWKRMRNERYAKYRWVAYGIIAASLAAFVYVCRRVRSLWVAQCLGQIFIILLSQLTCYYYSFMILSAPLTRVKRQIEVPLFGLAALTQFIWMASYWNDDKYTALTAVSLAFCYYLLFVFSGLRMPWARRHEPEVVEGDQPAAEKA
ncbi:hypothetical protein WMF31_22970 [Sorangium sp. So ce1036]|uniref:hypothetical protein n=1 Tax=Sorangium sp. So ce1036 TaxID=3133328 RepID=UPI003F12B203